MGVADIQGKGRAPTMVERESHWISGPTPQMAILSYPCFPGSRYRLAPRSVTTASALSFEPEAMTVPVMVESRLFLSLLL